MYISSRRKVSDFYRRDLLANYTRNDMTALACIFEKAAATYSRDGDSGSAQALLIGSKVIRDRVTWNRDGSRL